MQAPPQRTGPLVGLKVLEIGHYIAAPFCTRILADLGAEVIKVEPPGGDPFRGWGASVDGHSVWFSVHGRNKLSVVLDLKRDRDTVLRLAARADVLVENLRAGGLERLGLGPEALHAVNPAPGDRAHLRLRPGRPVPRQAGVRRDRRGDGRHPPPHRASRRQLGPAAAALRHLDQRRPGRAVCRDRAAVGAVAARRGRDRARPRGGREPGGQRVQPDGGHAAGIRHGRARAAAGGRGNRDRGADQHLSLRRRQMAVHRRQLGPDLRPADGGDRPAGAGARPGLRAPTPIAARIAATLDAAIAAWTRTLPAKEAEALLEAADVPCSRLYDIADCANDPHFRARGSVQEVADPLIGRTLHPGPVIRLDGDAPEAVVAWPGPAAGAHTEYVLRTLLGMADDRG